MAFLPFNIAKQKKLKVVIVGGGYAGLAALTNLLQFAPDTDITLIDPRAQHLKITHLHETFRYPITDLLFSFCDLENRFGCKHVRASVNFDKNTLQNCQKNKQIILDDEAVLNFDYMIIASGCENSAVDAMDSTNVFSLHDFTAANGSDLLDNFFDQDNTSKQVISVVGGGATGIQFLFEIKQFLVRKKYKTDLRLIHSGEHVLEQFPEGFGAYAESRMRDLEIAFYPNTYYSEQHTAEISLVDKITKKQFELSSSMSILFLGKNRQKAYTTNAFGQIIINQKPLQNIFAAGDCAHYQSLGSNTLTAQSAVRKGKLVARNILRHSGFPGLLEPYMHHELGYVVSIGPSDAVGWLVSEGNLITGIPALTIKELVEAQYDLLLSGIDTYLV
ncbi:NAD(P)/FAD-dependent oxidoreductase [Nitrosomonas supralitoralis]|uniref:Pyridine nucleotide-disulfide oxidoreductase n=1 Tax=Nitrosomonas supralitoralis TaxID=2116706 RepID=A0A2P7NVK9_9PROT|nr:FAD-dependent oxidoreductase [Nitrosomonas supralitoralis]PSJ17511.1 pyridine nucleotide-disulfide oxidoreductase [Nitrosomonas supralitoralis]